MSLDLYPAETVERIGALSPVQSPEPGAFDGFVRGAGLATMRSLARTARSIDLAGAIGPIAEDAVTGGTTAQDRYFKEHEETWGNAVDYWTPKPNEVGVAGEMVGQLLGTLGLVVASPSLAVAEMQLGTAEDLVRKGVSAPKAQAVGTLQAAGLGLGVWMPILGQNLWQRLVVGGAGYNLAQGAVTRGASGLILEGTPQAEEFKMLDPAALTLDVLLGAAFGGLAHASPAMRVQGKAAWERLSAWAQNLTPSDVAALVALRQAQHLNVDSAPGKPASPADVQAHVERTRQAIEQLSTDQPVEVSDLPEPKFTLDPAREAEAVARTEELAIEAERIRVEEQLPSTPPADLPLEITPNHNLVTHEHQAMEARFAAQLQGDVEGAIKSYADLPGTVNGKVLSTDLARELSPDYAASKDSKALLAQVVHEPASALIKEMYARALEHPSVSGLNMVTFTAGGTGNGKTSAISKTAHAQAIAEHSDIVYDTNMNTYSSARQKIEMALEKGKQVNILYVGRDPIEALVNGAIPRAEQTGRTVPLNEHARTHLGAPDAIGRLLQDYAGDERVQFVFIDNSFGKGKSEITGSQLLNQFNLVNLEPRLKEALDREYKAGRVSAINYEGFAGHAPGREGALPGAAREPVAQPERAGGGAPGESAAGTQAPPAPDEVAGAAPPQPGQKFLVFRLGRTETLAHRNAGNADAIARYIMGVEDEMGPVSSKADKVFAYEVSTEKPFGAYEGLTGGRPGNEAAVGRVARGDEVAYSFPEGGYGARLVGTKSLEELRGELQAIGHQNFDEAGSRAGAQVLRKAFGVTQTEAPAAKPGGVTESPPPRGPAARVEAAGAAVSDPVARAADQVITQTPDRLVSVGQNPDGTPIVRTLREYLEAERAEADLAREDVKLFELAADCMIRGS